MGKIKSFFLKADKFFSSLLFPSGIKCAICGKELSASDEHICPECHKASIFNNGKVCKKCGSKLKGKRLVCFSCKEKETFYKRARSPFVYEGKIVQTIHKLKYSGAKYLAKSLAVYMAEEVVVADFKFDVITYVPVTEKREKERGYNQSKVLAKELAIILNKPVVDALEKKKETISQTKLGYSDRVKNLEGAFRCKNKASIKNKKVLLVDDVLTTGATAENCSFEMIKAGANEINVITAASTEAITFDED